MDRAQKEAVIEELGQIFTDSGAVVVCHYTGLSVAEMQDYRARMREAGASVRVAKNRLAKIALEGTPCEGMKDLLTGQTVIGYAEDPVSAAKVTEAYAKDNEKLVVLGGAMGNIIDRTIYGYVVDFLDFSGLHFPWVFNVADMAINVGVALLLLDAWQTRNLDDPTEK